MRKKSKIEYGKAREDDLADVCRRLIESFEETWRMADLIRAAVCCPARRFYVSEERAIAVVSRMRRGKPVGRMTMQKRRMFAELYRRAMSVVEMEGVSVAKAVARVIYSPAPEFYISVETARGIVCGNVLKQRDLEASPKSSSPPPKKMGRKPPPYSPYGGERAGAVGEVEVRS